MLFAARSVSITFEADELASLNKLFAPFLCTLSVFLVPLNFIFVVFYGKSLQENSESKETSVLDSKSKYSFELQTAPISDGVLTGVIRQLVIEYVLPISDLYNIVSALSWIFIFSF